MNSRNKEDGLHLRSLAIRQVCRTLTPTFLGLPARGRSRCRSNPYPRALPSHHCAFGACRGPALAVCRTQARRPRADLYPVG